MIGLKITQIGDGKMPHGLQWIDFISDICFPIWGTIVIVLLIMIYRRMKK